MYEKSWDNQNSIMHLAKEARLNHKKVKTRGAGNYQSDEVKENARPPKELTDIADIND